MILLCVIGILLSLGLTFEVDFTHFPEPGIAAAVLHEAHLIFGQSQSDLSAVAGHPVPLFALQGGDPELVAEVSPPRISGEGGLLQRESDDGSLEGALNLVAFRRVRKHRVAHIIFGGFRDPLSKDAAPSSYLSLA